MGGGGGGGGGVGGGGGGGGWGGGGRVEALNIPFQLRGSDFLSWDRIL